VTVSTAIDRVAPLHRQAAESNAHRHDQLVYGNVPVAVAVAGARRGRRQQEGKVEPEPTHEDGKQRPPPGSGMQPI
jgi:hypothetical protein